MQRILYGTTNMGIETIVDEIVGSNRITKADFRKICKKLISDLADFEIDSIFNELNKSKRDSLDVQDLYAQFSHLEQERQFKTGIEDILKPLQTMMKRKSHGKPLTIADKFFDRYDQNRNKSLDASELSNAMGDELGYTLTKEEQQTLTEFFKNKYANKDEIKLHQFKELITMQFKRIYKKNDALRALKKINKRLRDTGRTLENILNQQDQYIKQTNLD